MVNLDKCVQPCSHYHNYGSEYFHLPEMCPLYLCSPNTFPSFHHSPPISKNNWAAVGHNFAIKRKILSKRNHVLIVTGLFHLAQNFWCLLTIVTWMAARKRYVYILWLEPLNITLWSKIIRIIGGAYPR